MSDTKVCARCGHEKSVEQFSKRSASPNGRHYYCRVCAAEINRKAYQQHRKERLALAKEYARDATNRARIHAYQVEYRKKYRPRRQARELELFYGISQSQYDAMLSEQNGACAICGKPEKRQGRRLGVDHCHETGEIRGLICLKCNIGIGSFDDDPATLMCAVRYLKKFTKQGQT